MKSFERSVRIDVDVEYGYKKGSGSSYSGSFGNYIPGDPPEASDIKCVALVSLHAIKEALKKAEEMKITDNSRLVHLDLFSSLDGDQRADVEDDCYEDAFQDEL